MCRSMFWYLDHFTSLRCVFHHIITVFKACFFVLHCIVVTLRCIYIVALLGNLDVVDCWSFWFTYLRVLYCVVVGCYVSTTIWIFVDMPIVVYAVSGEPWWTTTGYKQTNFNSPLSLVPTMLTNFLIFIFRICRCEYTSAPEQGVLSPN
jgi:hypothetical protein